MKKSRLHYMKQLFNYSLVTVFVFVLSGCVGHVNHGVRSKQAIPTDEEIVADLARQKIESQKKQEEQRINEAKRQEELAIPPFISTGLF